MYIVLVVLWVAVLIFQIYLIRQDRKRTKQIKKIKRMICQAYDLPPNVFDLWSDETISKMITTKIAETVLREAVK